MNSNGPRTDSREVPEYHLNRCRFPLEELARYRGLYVAFSLDGSKILAGGKTMEEVEEKLLASNIHPRDVVGSFIDHPSGFCEPTVNPSSSRPPPHRPNLRSRLDGSLSLRLPQSQQDRGQQNADHSIAGIDGGQLPGEPGEGMMPAPAARP